MTNASDEPRAQCVVCRAALPGVLMPFHRAWHDTAEVELVAGHDLAQDGNSQRI